MVLHFGEDYFIPRLREVITPGSSYQIDPFRCAPDKNDLVRGACAHELGQGLATSLVYIGGQFAQVMAAAMNVRITPSFEFVHFFEHDRGTLGRSGVIQIDKRFPVLMSCRQDWKKVPQGKWIQRYLMRFLDQDMPVFRDAGWEFPNSVPTWISLDVPRRMISPRDAKGNGVLPLSCNLGIALPFGNGWFSPFVRMLGPGQRPSDVPAERRIMRVPKAFPGKIVGPRPYPGKKSQTIFARVDHATKGVKKKLKAGEWNSGHLRQPWIKATENLYYFSWPGRSADKPAKQDRF
jgi:hypothetical protein